MKKGLNTFFPLVGIRPSYKVFVACLTRPVMVDSKSTIVHNGTGKVVEVLVAVFDYKKHDGLDRITKQLRAQSLFRHIMSYESEL